MKKHLLSFAVLMMGIALFTACDDKDDEPIYVPVAVSNGAYVICGGNMSSNIDGTLTYIDYSTGTAAQSQFKAKNGRSLGLTVNDAIVYGSKMYIVVTNANTVEVVDAKTLNSIKQIKMPELVGTEKGILPRCIACADGLIYVSTYGSSTADWGTYTYSGNGYVAAIDTTNFSLKNTYTAGSFPEGIAVANGNLYVANSNYSFGMEPSVSVINLSTGVDTPITNKQITNPTKLAVAGSDIYVLDMGNYADVASGVRRISGSTVTTLFDATHATFEGHNIYACNSLYGTIPTEFYVYNINNSTKNTISTGLGDKFFSPNAIGVDPITGHIFIASYNENPSRPGYAGYSVDGYVVEYDATGTIVKQYECGVGPNAIVFNTGVKYVKE